MERGMGMDFFSVVLLIFLAIGVVVKERQVFGNRGASKLIKENKVTKSSEEKESLKKINEPVQAFTKGLQEIIEIEEEEKIVEKPKNNKKKKETNGKKAKKHSQKNFVNEVPIIQERAVEEAIDKNNNRTDYEISDEKEREEVYETILGRENLGEVPTGNIDFIDLYDIPIDTLEFTSSLELSMDCVANEWQKLN